MERVCVYPSVKSGLWIMVFGIVIGLVGWWIIGDDGANTVVRIISGYGGILFGIACLIPLALAMWERITGRPYIVIWSDRLDYYIPLQRKYGSVRFSDVAGFRVANVASQRFISVDYKPATLIREADRVAQSRFGENVIEANLHLTGAIHNLQASGLTVGGDELLRMLNDRIGASK